MIVITGAAGFIGSCLVRFLNANGRNDLILVDDFHRPDKNLNLRGKQFRQKIDRNIFLSKWFPVHHADVSLVFHLGARTDTGSTDTALFNALNLQYSIDLWNLCAKFGIPLLYASSAATYGHGEQGYSDDPTFNTLLQPLNEYALSKHSFDEYVISNQAGHAPPYYTGFKFFNVYGPNEYHKGSMASVVFHGYRQIREKGSISLFRSHREGIADGMQQRDFIYVKDVLEVLWYFAVNRPEPGIYNLGTGRAEPFLNLARGLFEAMDVTPAIEWIDTPEHLREKYQYYTQAEMARLQKTGYDRPFTPLKEGIKDYVQQYLQPGAYY